MQAPPKPLHHVQHGFSLIEVLVSVIVLSFGLLGMVGLQAASLQANREARLQSTAVRLGEEMGELMRSNKITSIQNTEAANPYLISSMTATSPGCGYPTSAAGCVTAEETAQRDVFEWLERVDSELPGARVVICQDATPQDTGGLPQWTCSNSGGVMVIKIGWTRANTLKGATGTDATSTTDVNEGAFDKALRPAVIFPVIAGSST
jgi:type IV pilus assembly protein PilV